MVLLLLSQFKTENHEHVEMEMVLDRPSLPDAYRHPSLYTPSMFRPDALMQNHYIPVTAIVHYRIVSGDVFVALQHLLQYPFIREILIYNETPYPLRVEVLYFGIGKREGERGETN